MAVSRGVRRLLRIREMEEEQSRMALESAQSELAQLENGLGFATALARRARELVAGSARTGDEIERMAGIEEARLAIRYKESLLPKIVDAELNVRSRRQEFLTVRVAREQVNTLISQAEKLAAVDEARKNQQALDDWFLNQEPGGAGKSGKEVDQG